MQENDLFNLLLKHGLRLTKTRRALIPFFLEEAPPLSARHILEKLYLLGQRVNKTTVYRELKRLQQIGIIRSVELGDRQKYYELAAQHHHHLVCIECEKVEDVDLDEGFFLKQEKELACERGFQVVRHALEFFGICSTCK